MKVLIGCEESQEVTKAFRALGHEAYSCDLLPCSGGHPEWHIQGDVLKEAYSGKYDMGIFFPPCTYMTNAGVRWLHTDPKRWVDLFDAADFFLKLWNAPISQIGIENPIMHRYGKRLIGIQQAQIIQPWMFGHGETKATCLWLKNLPLLQPTNIVSGREQRIWKLPPGPERAKLRSKTFPGIAEAIANQWSSINQLKLAI
jgi:hypothetical protein